MMFDFSQMANEARASEEFFARAQAQMMGAQTHARTNRDGDTRALAPEIQPEEAVYWTCKRASLQGWKVRVENVIGGWRATFQRGDQCVSGPVMSDKRPALFQACEGLQPYLEGATR